MTPMPVKPKVVVFIDEDGNLMKFASNLSFDLEVVVETKPYEYREMTAGLPYKIKPQSD
jgi:hypothetical protein